MITVPRYLLVLWSFYSSLVQVEIVSPKRLLVEVQRTQSYMETLIVSLVTS